MKEKIKELFAMLPREEQLELLRELTSSDEFRNPIVHVNAISQEQYRKNIEFKVENRGDQLVPNIHVVLTTPWGNFEANGNNQKIAKAKAAELALMALSTPTAEWE